MSDEEIKDDALTPLRAQPLTKRSGALVRRGLEEAEGLKGLDKMQPSSERSGLRESDPWAVLRAGLDRLRGDVTNSLGMKLVRIPAGKFMMGSDAAEDEKPIHEVTINKSFYMGRHPVTQSQWQEIMGNNPSEFIGDDYPVHCVSWDDAQEFIRKLNLLDVEETPLYDEGTGEARPRTRLKYRLPSEAEWEYACRAGSATEYAGSLDFVAWYANNSGETYFDAEEIWGTGIFRIDERGGWHFPYHERLVENTNRVHAVGTKAAKAFGLYDMHGNVWEWCQDFYDKSYYRNSASTDPKGPNKGEFRVKRGGSWFDRASELRVARRGAAIPSYGGYDVGLRLVAVNP